MTFSFETLNNAVPLQSLASPCFEFTAAGVLWPALVWHTCGPYSVNSKQLCDYTFAMSLKSYQGITVTSHNK